jgi:hypothetical protein
MHRFLLSCLTVLTFMTSQAPSANAFELSKILNRQNTTSEESPTLHDPKATPCLDIVAGCSVITLDQNSIELLQPELSVGLDGSLTITAIGSWTNSRGLNSHQGEVVIRLPKQLRPLVLPEVKGATRQPTLSDVKATCSEPAPVTGNPLSLTQLSEMLMGQQAISQSAALFTSGCQR